MATLQSKDRPADPSSSEPEPWLDLVAAAVQVKVYVNEGQGDFPEASLAGQGNSNNEDAPLVSELPSLFFLGFLFIGILAPLWVGKALAWTEMDPLGTAFQVALYQIFVFGCFLVSLAVLRAVVKVRKRLRPNEITLSPRIRISRQDRLWAIYACFVLWTVTYFCLWIPMFLWAESDGIRSVLKKRKTYLTLESIFDVKDVLLNLTDCLNDQVHERKAEITDVIICLQRLGILSGLPA